jgi:hypothetical protein
MVKAELGVALYRTAQLDYKASRVLIKNDHITQALFYLEQAFEKANKAVWVHLEVDLKYRNELVIEKQLISKKYGHNNRQPAYEVWKLMLDEDQERLKQSSNQMDIERLLKIPQDFIEDFKSRKQQYHITHYKELVKIYYDQYRKAKNDPKLQPDPILVPYALYWILSKCFEGIVMNARYPNSEFCYMNIAYLNAGKNKAACKWLYEMVGDFFKNLGFLVKAIDDKLPSYLSKHDLITLDP